MYQQPVRTLWTDLILTRSGKFDIVTMAASQADQRNSIGVVEHMKLEYFVQAYSRLQFQFHSADWRDENLWHTQLDHDSRITVALIDTGVNPGLSAAFDPMSTSFVHTAGGESPWFCSHHPHGTQMARIISQLDPSCKILVIKISETGRDISAERLTEVFEYS